MLFSILIVILSLGLLVGIHELCHMLVAKAFGIKVLKFSFGFGKRLLHWQGKETSYELRLLPLGGFVQMKGEDPIDKSTDGFFGVAWYKRALVALAGPAANLVLGLLILFVLLLCNHWPVIAAAEQTSKISSVVIVETSKWVGGTVTAKSHVSDISGPIMVTKMMVSSLKESVGQFFLLLSVISLSLGLFNLVPLPALDGGHVMLHTIEGIRGKALPAKVYQVWNTIGIFLLVALMAFVIYTDLVKLLH